MKYALVSLFDKTGIESLVGLLSSQGYTIISTGGTFKAINQILGGSSSRLIQVSDLTKFPEILDGRVKTLNPIIFGGILARRDIKSHQSELQQHNIPYIDVVVCNLYPFHEVDKDTTMEEATELIDIGGVTLIRAAAKNWNDVTVLIDPADYQGLATNNTAKDPAWRQYLAAKAFNHTHNYDLMISQHLGFQAPQLTQFTRTYQPTISFKYGCNPHQGNSGLAMIGPSKESPIKVLNGEPGFINMLDALNSWQLVSEASQILPNYVAVASFKHTSPAGVAITNSRVEGNNGLDSNNSSNMGMVTALTFEAARNCDPMCSFGDFIAISNEVGVETAEMIKREVSDGIIAPSYTQAALEILAKKKGNRYLILQVDPKYSPKEDIEVREMWGLALTQAPNRAIVGLDVFADKNIVTRIRDIPDLARADMLLANVTLKYAQSNNVVMAKDGVVIGVAAGQQSRVDAVKLAGRKATTWWLRNHPKAITLDSLFKSSVKRQDRVNAVIRYVEGDFTPIEHENWLGLFEIQPTTLTQEDKAKWMKELTGVSMASDAFFPFRDNIDHASKFGVQYVIQPGGSQADPQIIEACNQYNMVMVMSGIRQFTH